MMNNGDMSIPRKTICILTDYLDVGGCESVLADAIDCLIDDYDVTIAALYGVSQEMRSKLVPEVAIRANLIGRSFNWIDFALLSAPVVGGWLFRRYIPGKYDYLILLRPGHLMAADSGKGKKVICWTHTDKDVMYANTENLSLLRRLNRYRLRQGFRKVDASWVVAEYIREEMSRAFDVTTIHTLDNPIDCKGIIEKAQAFVPDVFDPACTNFVMVGRLSPEKGHIRALRALKHLKNEYPCRMIVVGDGQERAVLEKYVQDHQLSDNVIFVGHQRNPYPYIQAADAMVVPSIRESFGLVLLEAMILKIPVISTATIGGIRVTNHGEYGILDENSDEGVERGMRKFLDRDQHPVENAYQWAWNFDKSCFGKRLKSLLMK